MKKLTLFVTMFIFCVVMGEDFSSIDDLVEKQLGQPMLCCPWREAYSAQREEMGVSTQCAFCAQILAQKDDRYLILRRFNYHFVMLNAFPVSKGHLLVVPYCHVPSLSDISASAREELMHIITFSIELLKNKLHIKGINFGANIGEMSGATIPDHVRIHIIPSKRYGRSFHEIISGVNSITWDMQKLYRELREAFNTLMLE